MRMEIRHPWQAIHRNLVERHGLDLSRYKETYLKRRLLVRIRALKLAGIEAYARYLKRHPEESGPLQRALSIKVTSFFRNRACFEFLEEAIVPDLLRRSAARGSRIAVWSAGCATGEEPFSLAALFATALDRGPELMARSEVVRARVRITATDVDSGAIESARRASFSSRAFLEAAPGDAARHFALRADGQALPSERLKRMVQFRRESLLDPIERHDL